MIVEGAQLPERFCTTLALFFHQGGVPLLSHKKRLWPSALRSCCVHHPTLFCLQVMVEDHKAYAVKDVPLTGRRAHAVESWRRELGLLRRLKGQPYVTQLLDSLVRCV